MLIDPADLSLNEVLRRLGYTKRHNATARGGQGSTSILAHEKVVFIGDAHQVWEWLRDTQQITRGKS